MRYGSIFVDVGVPTVPLYGSTGPMVPMVTRGPALVTVGPNVRPPIVPPFFHGGNPFDLTGDAGAPAIFPAGGPSGGGGGVGPGIGPGGHATPPGGMHGLADACCDGCASGGDCCGGHDHGVKSALLKKYAGIPVWGWLALAGGTLGVLGFSHKRNF